MKFSLYIAVVLTASLCACANKPEQTYEEKISVYSCQELKTEKSFLEQLASNLQESEKHNSAFKTGMANFLSYGLHPAFTEEEASEKDNYQKRYNDINRKTTLVETHINKQC